MNNENKVIICENFLNRNISNLNIIDNNNFLSDDDIIYIDENKIIVVNEENPQVAIEENYENAEIIAVMNKSSNIDLYYFINNKYCCIVPFGLLILALILIIQK